MNRSNTDRMTRALRELTKQTLPYSVIATVVSIEGETCTVSPIDGKAQYSEIRLQPESANPGLLLVPKVGSVVMVVLNNDADGFISMVSECDSVIIRSTDGNVVQLQDGSLGGIPVTSDLVTQLNNIESDINDLKSIFASWVPVANDGGAALKSALGSYPSSTLTPTTDDDIENESVTHGVP